MSNFTFKPYHYKAKVYSVYDGDTITLIVDQGFGDRSKKTFRLSRINAWEVRGEEREEGLEARDYVRSVLRKGQWIYIKTEKDKTGKYGRYLADIYIISHAIGEEPKFVNINDNLVQLGHAIYKMY